MLCPFWFTAVPPKGKQLGPGPLAAPLPQDRSQPIPSTPCSASFDSPPPRPPIPRWRHNSPGSRRQVLADVVLKLQPHQLTPGKDSTLLRLLVAMLSGSWPGFSSRCCSSSPSSTGWSTSTGPSVFHLHWVFFQRGREPWITLVGVTLEEMAEDRSLGCNGSFSLVPGGGINTPLAWSLTLVGFASQFFLRLPYSLFSVHLSRQQPPPAPFPNSACWLLLELLLFLLAVFSVAVELTAPLPRPVLPTHLSVP